jgi:hypothetical protein
VRPHQQDLQLESSSGKTCFGPCAAQVQPSTRQQIQAAYTHTCMVLWFTKHQGQLRAAEVCNERCTLVSEPCTADVLHGTPAHNLPANTSCNGKKLFYFSSRKAPCQCPTVYALIQTCECAACRWQARGTRVSSHSPETPAFAAEVHVGSHALTCRWWVWVALPRQQLASCGTMRLSVTYK